MKTFSASLIPLSVDADVTVSTPYGDAFLWADGPVVRFDAPSWRAVRALMSLPPLRTSRRRRSQAVRQFSAALTASGLRLDVAVRGHRVARLGHAARPAWVARLAGLKPLEVRWRGLWSSLRRRSSGTPDPFVG